MLESKEIGLWFEYSSLEPFLHVGIFLLAFKSEGKTPEEKDWLKGIAGLSDIPLYLAVEGF